MLGCLEAAAAALVPADRPAHLAPNAGMGSHALLWRPSQRIAGSKRERRWRPRVCSASPRPQLPPLRSARPSQARRGAMAEPHTHDDAEIARLLVSETARPLISLGLAAWYGRPGPSGVLWGAIRAPQGPLAPAWPRRPAAARRCRWPRPPCTPPALPTGHREPGAVLRLCLWRRGGGGGGGGR